MSTNMELITSVTVGSGGAASVTLPATGTIPQTYTDLKIVYSARSTANTGSEGYDAVFYFNGSQANRTSKVLRGDGSTASSNTIDEASTFRLLRAMEPNDYTASVFSNGEIYIPNYTSSNYKSFSVDAVLENNATATGMSLIAGLWSNTAAITTITLGGINGNLVQGSTFYLYGISNVTSTTKATGGIVSSDGTYNYHIFPYSGTFTPTQNISVDYLVIAGGGGGSDYGGGGAGGLRSTVGATGGGGSLESALSLTANTAYTVTVGAGGNGGSIGTNGSNSVFSTITSTGGGRGSNNAAPAQNTGSSGGSGGGGKFIDSSTFGNGGAASPSGQGFAGGNGYQSDAVNNFPAGGGGGAGAAGGNATSVSVSGNGGNGVAISAFANATQTGLNTYYAGGGGGGLYATSLSTQTTGGLGGGGAGGNKGTGATAGIINLGAGGGGAGTTSGSGGAGGSGLVIIRYAI